MTLRLRFPQGKLVRRHRSQGRELVMVASSLLTPTCVMAYVLAFWRLAADIGLAGDSGLRGVFSHWQLWIVLAVALQATSRILARRASHDQNQATR
ncbi:MAG: hypothetical protein WDO18_16885 [Acidobacteriota bacterium]